MNLSTPSWGQICQGENGHNPKSVLSSVGPVCLTDPLLVPSQLEKTWDLSGGGMTEEFLSFPLENNKALQGWKIILPL